MGWGLVRHYIQTRFLWILGVVLESPNTIVVAFGNMGCGKAVGLAGTTHIVVSVIMVFFLFCFFFGFLYARACGSPSM